MSKFENYITYMLLGVCAVFVGAFLIAVALGIIDAGIDAVRSIGIFIAAFTVIPAIGFVISKLLEKLIGKSYNDDMGQ